jgi:hypothetical protein
MLAPRMGVPLMDAIAQRAELTQQHSSFRTPLPTPARSPADVSMTDLKRAEY